MVTWWCCGCGCCWVLWLLWGAVLAVALSDFMRCCHCCAAAAHCGLLPPPHPPTTDDPTRHNTHNPRTTKNKKVAVANRGEPFVSAIDDAAPGALRAVAAEFGFEAVEEARARELASRYYGAAVPWRDFPAEVATCFAVTAWRRAAGGGGGLGGGGSSGGGAGGGAE